jgi:carbon starvation protein
MKVISFLIWVIIATIGSFSFGIATKLILPSEEINAIWIVIAALCIFVIAYRFYGAFLSTKVFALNKDRVTPAIEFEDGKDYYPTNKWVLLGHHFAAIAGAGPLVGPVLAAQFGYLPGMLWILIGAVFAGAVHDFVVLIASVRRGGKSLAHIAKDEVGPVTGYGVSIAILFIIIIALAGLGLVVVNSLTYAPWGTFIIFMTIPIAIFMGIYMKSTKDIVTPTVIGIIALMLTIIFGKYIPQSSIFNLSREGITFSIAVYGFIASVLPVWFLLAPRDYLSTYMKIGTILILAIGVIIVDPKINMPSITQFVRGGGPVIPGKVFPFMFITIACGAVSGFHSLISSGTTPKMIKNELDVKMIGFGAMLIEGFVGIMALIAATVLLPGDYFAINSKLAPEILKNIGYPPVHIKELSRLIGIDVSGRPGGAVVLAVGMAYVFFNLPGMKELMGYWYNFAIMFEALFILTTIDAGTRVARFILQEIGGIVYKPLAETGWMPGAIATSMIVVIAWGSLIYSGSISTIWPMFGVANQILAAIALSIGTTIIIRRGKLKYVWVTLLPMIFMIIITLTTSYKLFFMFIYRPAITFKINACLIVIMVITALVVFFDSILKWYSCINRSINKS